MRNNTKYYSSEELEINDKVLADNVVGLSIVEPSEIKPEKEPTRVRYSKRSVFSH